MTAFLIQVSARGLAQKVTYVQHNASLRQLFSEIRKQTGYNVFWQDAKVNDKLKFEANFRNEALEDVLNEVLSPQALTYAIVNHTVVVKKKEKSLVEKVTSLFMNVTIVGKVLDAESGKPIPNATVTLKGSSRRVFTNENGTFTFADVPDNGVLVFSYVGYNTQEATALESMIVKLTLGMQKLDEVVISTGYQQLKKSSATGAYSVIDAKEIERTPTLNLMERTAAKVPGVYFDVRNNTIQIRSANGLNGNTPPLIVIDGFPAINQNLTTVTTRTIDGNPNNLNQPATSGNAVLSTINPNDIESITFLKDAAASAIWGAKAANGVIVITTKRGRKGNASINYNTTFSVSSPASLSNLTSMSSREYIDLEQEMFDKGFLTDPIGSYRYGPISEAQEWMFRVNRRTATAAQRDSALNTLAGRSNQSQLRKYLLQRATTQQHNLSLSGGGENNTYYIAANYSKDVPVFKSNYGETYSLTSNLNNDFLNKRISVATGINYTYSKSQVNNTSLQSLGFGAFGYRPYEMLVDQNGNGISKPIAFTQRVSDSLQRIGYMPWTYNPLDELNYNNTVLNKNNIRINTAIKGTITSWLNLTLSGQLQKLIGKQTFLQNKNSYDSRNLINIGTTFSGRTAIYGVPVGGVYKTSSTGSDEYAMRGQFNVDKTIGDHHFDAIAGTEIRQIKFNGSTQTLYGYDEELGLGAVVNPTTPYRTIFGYSTTLGFSDGKVFNDTKRYLSYYNNASYAYRDKYFVSGSVRLDDYTMQGVDRRNRAVPLYSAGLRWNIKRESFLEKVGWIGSLNIRTTLGTGGNIPTQGRPYTVINTGLFDSYTLLPTATIGTPGNTELGWETTRTINEGLDADLFNSRLTISLDVYQKKTTGLLVNLPYNSTYGWNILTFNGGSMKGRGAELSISGQIVRGKNWGFISAFNGAYNKNEITESRFVNTNSSPFTSILVKGYPVDNVLAYRWAGLDATGQSQIYSANGTILTSQSFPQVKPEDLVYMGRSTPPYFGGWTNTVRYRNLSLIARASYALGHKFRLRQIDQSTYPSGGSFSGYISNSQVLAQRWRNPGDEAITNVPGLSGINFNSIDWYSGSDINIRNAGNIRLQQLTLNYALPASALRALSFVKGVNFGVTATNLGLLWVSNKEGVDPDYQMTNSFNNLPPSRTFLFNMNISL
uniref:SusC/RagA family TonB-linked outer membrane protein n=1 Tax=Mucilaginibacter sp. Bleaf8 TaxID=2834430 RepID=UPI0020BE6EE0|nr:SusC/RagA family TonB-linked outer membrane protein [Mucilaginibacter sp. Bleaf8]